MRRLVLSSSPIVYAIACIVASGCGSASDVSLTSPSSTQSRCQPSFDAAPRSFGAEGGTSSVSVTVARECSWSATSGAAWVVITSGSQGQGDGSVVFRVDRNTDPVGRSGAIVLGDARVDVAQQAAACGFDVSPPARAVAAQGGVLQLQIRTHALCNWNVVSDSGWASVAPASGRGNATVSITVAVNTGSARSAIVVAAGQRFQITQSSGAPGPPPPPPAPTPQPPAPPPAPPPPPPVGTEVEVTGAVEGLIGICPILRFSVRGTVVVTTSRTDFKSGSCRDVKNSVLVRVRGRTIEGGILEASDVDIRD